MLPLKNSIRPDKKFIEKTLLPNTENERNKVPKKKYDKLFQSRNSHEPKGAKTCQIEDKNILVQDFNALEDKGGENDVPKRIKRVLRDKAYGLKDGSDLTDVKATSHESLGDTVEEHSVSNATEREKDDLHENLACQDIQSSKLARYIIPKDDFHYPKPRYFGRIWKNMGLAKNNIFSFSTNRIQEEHNYCKKVATTKRAQSWFRILAKSLNPQLISTLGSDIFNLLEPKFLNVELQHFLDQKEIVKNFSNVYVSKNHSLLKL